MRYAVFAHSYGYIATRGERILETDSYELAKQAMLTWISVPTRLVGAAAYLALVGSGLAQGCWQVRTGGAVTPATSPTECELWSMRHAYDPERSTEGNR